MGLKVPTQDYFYPGKLKFFNNVTETISTSSYEVKDLIKTSGVTVCGSNDGQGKNNLEQYQTNALNPMGKTKYIISGTGARPSSSQSFPVFSYAAHYAAIELNGFGNENWYIPSVAEFESLNANKSIIDGIIDALNETPISAGKHWTSTIANSNGATINTSGRWSSTSSNNISEIELTTSEEYNNVRVFYDFTGELEVE